MDFVASLLSYAPTIAGWRGGLFYYDARALCRLQIWQIIETAKSLGIAIPPKLLTYIESGECLDAGLEILRKIPNVLSTTTVYTITEEVTRRVTTTTTVTLPRTVTIWRSSIKTKTLVSTVTKPYPIYIIVTKSIVTTKEVTVTVKELRDRVLTIHHNNYRNH